MRRSSVAANVYRLARFLALVWCASAAVGTTGTLSAASAEGSGAKITRFPETLDKNCRNGRAKLFDECADQAAMFRQALRRANREGKVLLVSFGAEWCIWCHVFDQYIHGGKTRFTYTFGGPDNPDRKETATIYEKEKKDVTSDANTLRSYVSKSFVVVHIDGQFAPSGHAVLEHTGADSRFDGSIPYVFTVTAEGRFAARLEPARVETRRDGWWDWYRGYSRAALMAHLAELHKAALLPQ